MVKKEKTVRMVALFFLLAASALLFLFSTPKTDISGGPELLKITSVSEEESEDVTLGQENDMVVRVALADTPAERTQGLSGRQTLAEGEGLLFVFDTEDFHGIWMKDMNFAIDILWLNQLSDNSFKIVDVAESVMPDTYPEVFRPSEPANFVLEVNTGFFDKHNLKIGDLIQIEEVESLSGL